MLPFPPNRVPIAEISGWVGILFAGENDNKQTACDHAAKLPFWNIPRRPTVPRAAAFSAARGHSRSIKMPRYHFDLVDHKTVEDKGGHVLADEVIASDVADGLAEDLYRVRPKLRGMGYSVVVSNAEGETMHKASVDEPVTLPLWRLPN